jgi:hypothetical protein
MLISSHAGWTYALSGGRRHRIWLTLGSMLPDLTAVALALRELAAGTSRDDLLDRVYHRSPYREVHMAGHSALSAAALWLLAPAGSARRAVSAGWLGHLAVDSATHADDAWPPLWPLTEWRIQSPVSHWQSDHHAREFAAVDAAGLALLLARHRSLTVAGAVVIAGGALVQQLREPGRPLGFAADPDARTRDLEEAAA